MKKILLSFVLLLACVGGWAQTTLTFNRDGQGVSVISDNDKVTAEFQGLTGPTTSFKGTQNKITNSVLCPDINASASQQARVLLFKISGLSSFDEIGITVLGLNMGGNYQSADTYDRTHQIDCSASTSKDGDYTDLVTFKQNLTNYNAPAEFELKKRCSQAYEEEVFYLKVTITPKSSTGCYFGLSKIVLSTANKSEELSDLIAVAKSYEAGTNFGDYTEASVNALKAAIEEAEAKVEAGNVTDADIEKLQAAIDALQVVLPNPNKFYVLRCNYENRYIYVNAANKLHWTGTAPAEIASNYVWKFVAGSTPNTVKMQSVHTQSYLNTVINKDQATFGEGVDVTIKKASVVGACVFEAGNADIGLHAHGQPNNTVIGYTNTAGANTYFFEEVEDFSHTLSVTSEWATLVLGFNATIPSGVEVYSVSETSGKSAKLEAVTEVVPANEAVLVKANNGNYTFGYTTTEGNIVDNKLEGTLFTKNVEKNAYVLAKVGDNVGFYSAKQTDGVFLNNANKAYLPADAVPAGARFLSFDFGTETAIEGVEGENGNVKTEIYDLAGRRVKAAQKGLYIVNGKVVIR